MNSVLQKQDIIRMREIALNALKEDEHSKIDKQNQVEQEERSRALAKKARASTQFLATKKGHKSRDNKGVQQRHVADQLLVHGMNIFFYLIIFCCILLVTALILFFTIE